MSLGIGEDIMARECILDWKLTMFLVQCGKNIVNTKTHVRIVFNLMMTIVEERNLACPDSPDILISDILLEKFIDMPYCHLTQLRDCVMKNLTYTAYYRRVQNPTDDYKVMTARLYPPPPNDANSVDTTPSIQVAQQGPYVSIPQILWVMSPELSLFLIGYVSSQPVAYDFILSLVTQFISNNRQTLLHPKNMDVAHIRHSGLYNIFHCSYLHRSQVRGILRDHVSPVVED